MDSEKTVNEVEVVPKDRVLLLQVLVLFPLIEAHPDALLADPQHGLSISPALHLQAPGRIVVEVQLRAWARVSRLHKVVAHVDVWESPLLRLDAVEVVVVLVNRLS